MWQYKRYRFDHFLCESSIADVLDAFISERRQNLAKSILEHRFLTTYNGAKRHWKGDHGTPTIDHAVEQMKRSVNDLKKRAQNVDVHAWQLRHKAFVD
jgi:hypothetical protein